MRKIVLFVIAVEHFVYEFKNARHLAKPGATASTKINKYKIGLF